jgi:hypothetical protein
MTEVRIVRLLATLTLLIGLLYAVAGILVAVFTFVGYAELTELTQQSGGAVRAAPRYGLTITSVVYMLFGALVIISALGMFGAREWARKMWLGLSVLIVAWNVIELIIHYIKGLVGFLDWIGTLAISAVVVVSWYLLRRPSTVSHFRRDQA